MPDSQKPGGESDDDSNSAQPLRADFPLPSTAAVSPVLLEVTWLMTLQVWWSYFWRTTVYVVLAGAFIGFLVGLVYGMLGNPAPDPMIFNVIGSLLTIPISFLVLRDMLEKNFKGFAIALVARPD